MPSVSSIDIVRVLNVNESNVSPHRMAWACKTPRIGDLGTIVFDGGGDVVRVESLQSCGQNAWSAEFRRSELEYLHGQHIEWDQLPPVAFRITEKLRIGMTRQEVIGILGEPDESGGVSRKYRSPSILKYSCVEAHFESWSQGGLKCLYMENEDGIGITLLD